jgi:hypothetical protein
MGVILLHDFLFGASQPNKKVFFNDIHTCSIYSNSPNCSWQAFCSPVSHCS